MQYSSHLYGSDMEGYIQILQLENGQAVKVFNTDYKGIKEIVELVRGNRDTFVTANSFYIPYRASDNVRHFRALYIDLDITRHGKEESAYQVYMLADQGKIPRPSMIVDSGRGLHLYWKIEHAPMGAIHTWQELEDYLYKQLEHLGADLRATDAARLLRLPGTYNSKNNAECKVLKLEDICYSMYELKEQYLHTHRRPKRGQIKKKKQGARIQHLFNSYTLHMARKEDILTLCELRNYRVKGYRNMILHCFAYWTGVTTREENELIRKTYELNEKFKQSLNEREVRAICKSVPKAVKKFIDYEQGLRMGEDKRVSKGMRDKGGYWYRNSTLIERLGITDQEQQHLKTIISENERNRRRNLKRKQARRNDEGLTGREQQKQATLKAINRLKSKGLSNSQIAKELGMTVKGVEYHLYY